MTRQSGEGIGRIFLSGGGSRIPSMVQALGQRMNVETQLVNPPNVASVVKNATADEVEREIRAQLDRARTMGFEPTHLDSHMGTLFATDAFIERYIKVGIEQKIPVMFFWTGEHSDYHRPTDTPEKINLSGMKRICDYAEKVITHLVTEPKRPEASSYR